MRQQIQLCCRPIEFVHDTIVVVRAGCDGWAEVLIHLGLVVIDDRIIFCPLICPLRCLGSLCYKAGISSLKRGIDTRCEGHGSREIECRSGSLEDDVTRFPALIGADEALKVGFGKLMIDTAIRVLHREHPADVVHSLGEHVGHGEPLPGPPLKGGWYIETQCIEIRLVHLVGHEPDAHGIAGVDDVLIVVAGIIPTAG